MAIGNKDIEMLSKLLDDRLKGLHIQMDTEFKLVNQELKVIKEQTIKTNSRVTKLEDKTELLKEGELTHVLKCPQIQVIKDVRDDIEEIDDEINKKFEKLNTDLEEYRLIKKYPKIGLGVIAVVCVILVISTFLMFSKIKSEINTQLSTIINKEQVDNNKDK